MSIPLIHLYAGFAMCSDGKTTMRVPLTDEQVVQLASDFAEQAAKILRWESQHVRGKTDTPTPDRGVPGAGR